MLFNSFGTIASQTGVVVPPTFVSAETSTDGAKVVTTFSKEMADPSGKHAQFTVEVASPASQYQKWSGYADTPVLTASYPNQVLFFYDGSTSMMRMVVSKYPIYQYGNGIRFKDPFYCYWYTGKEWWDSGHDTNDAGSICTDWSSMCSFQQANNPVYTDNALAAIAFAKTTSDIAQNVVTAAALNATTTKIDLALTTAVTVGQTVTIAYTAGTVISADTGMLASFTAQEVTNNSAPPASPYQAWSGLSDSPDLTSSYPYQVIALSYGTYVLIESTTKCYYSSPYVMAGSGGGTVRFYNNSAGTWAYNIMQTGPIVAVSMDKVTQANADIYTDSSLTSVYFAKTTP